VPCYPEAGAVTPLIGAVLDVVLTLAL